MIILVWFVFFMVLLFLVSITQNMLFLGCALLSTGLLFFYLRKKVMVLNARMVLIMGIYLIIWGALIMADAIIDTGYDYWIFMEGFAGMFLGLGIHQGIIKAITCKEKVNAVYLGAKMHGAKAGYELYEPLFSYKYQNRQYQGSTGETFNKRKLEKRYQKGKNCFIYLNPQNANMICTKRYPQGSAIMMICIGIVLACIPFCMK